MDFVQLTETQRRDFNENGYLIVPQALDRATVDRLIEGGDRLMESFEYADYYAHRRPGLIQEGRCLRITRYQLKHGAAHRSVARS